MKNNYYFIKSDTQIFPSPLTDHHLVSSEIEQWNVHLKSCHYLQPQGIVISSSHERFPSS